MSHHDAPQRRIIGIDPGTHVLGYGVVEVVDARVNWVASGAFSISRSLPLYKRLQRLHSQLVEVIEHYRPDAAAIEEPFVAKNPHAALAVGQGMAIAMLAAAQQGLSVACYPPTKVKGSVAGHGRSSKERVQQMVRLQLELDAEPQPEDAADALAVALCHVQEERLRALNTGTRRRVVSPLSLSRGEGN